MSFLLCWVFYFLKVGGIYYSIKTEYPTPFIRLLSSLWRPTRTVESGSVPELKFRIGTSIDRPIGIRTETESKV